MKNVHYLGKTLEEWKDLFENKYSYNELYRMVSEGANFKKMLALNDY